jgi:hypothetical protein
MATKTKSTKTARGEDYYQLKTLKDGQINQYMKLNPGETPEHILSIDGRIVGIFLVKVIN